MPNASSPVVQTILPEPRRGLRRRRPEVLQASSQVAPANPDLDQLRAEVAALRLAAIATPAEVKELQQELAVARDAGRRARAEVADMAQIVDAALAESARLSEQLSTRSDPPALDQANDQVLRARLDAADSLIVQLRREGDAARRERDEALQESSKLLMQLETGAVDGASLIELRRELAEVLAERDEMRWQSQEAAGKAAAAAHDKHAVEVEGLRAQLWEQTTLRERAQQRATDEAARRATAEAAVREAQADAAKSAQAQITSAQRAGELAAAVGGIQRELDEWRKCGKRLINMLDVRAVDARKAREDLVSAVERQLHLLAQAHGTEERLEGITRNLRDEVSRLTGELREAKTQINDARRQLPSQAVEEPKPASLPSSRQPATGAQQLLNLLREASQQVG